MIQMIAWMISMKGCGEAFWVFTPFDPETTEKQRMINSAFEGQAQLDIWKKKYTDVRRVCR